MGRDPPKIDRYEVLGQLGKGANGIVYLAHDPRVGREVAIKVINPERVKDQVVQQRFHREAKAIARLHHPNIMQLLDYSGPNARIPYLVVEKLNGKNLDDVLVERGQPLDGVMAAAVLHEICLALQHAHNHSIVHRDLKPENVFIEPEGRIVLCDFGIARSFDADESGTLAGQNTRLAGSPLYMSPEQIAAPTTVGAPSDMFALGSLLYFLTTLKHAFISDSVVNVLKRIVAATPDSLREARPGLPDRLYRIVEKLHQKDPGKRYSSAAAIGDSALLVMKEAGHSDARRALKGVLQTLGHQSAQLSRSQLRSLEQMDDEAKTVVTSLAPPSSKVEVRTPSAPVTATATASQTATASAAGSPAAVTVEKSRATHGASPSAVKRTRKPAKSNTNTIVIAAGIIGAALILSAVLIVSSMRGPTPRPAPPLPAPAQQVVTGTLRLSVQPTADVFVDERRLGSSSNLGPMPLPPGTHRLLLMHPKLGRYEQTVEIAAGADTNLSVDLRKH